MYLIYIGYKSLKAKPQTTSELEETAPIQKILTPWNSVRVGFLTNVLNPKATLFFLAVFTQVINSTTPKFIQLLYGIEMVVMTFIWFSLVSIFFSNNRIKVRINKVQHHIERFTGVILIALGIKVALASRR